MRNKTQEVKVVNDAAALITDVASGVCALQSSGCCIAPTLSKITSIQCFSKQITLQSEPSFHPADINWRCYFKIANRTETQTPALDEQ
jgi:hypothetical protein